MSYRLYAVKRNPLALWNLDDTAPFQEHSGTGYVGEVNPGSTAPTKAASLVYGAEWSSVFDSTHVGRFTSPVFQQGMEHQSFALEAWVYPITRVVADPVGPIKILSHTGIYDGLTIEGNVVKFTTKYLTADDSVCSFDLSMPRAAHVVGLHMPDYNALYVNGEEVDRVEITDAQKLDDFNDGATQYLYCGTTTTSAAVAVNGVAIYRSIGIDGIKANYESGIRVTQQASVYPPYDATGFALNSGQGNAFMRFSWDSEEEFKNGLIDKVSISEEMIFPEYSDGVSVAGSWTGNVELTSTSNSIYGVMVEWSGLGVTVEGSLDATTWVTLDNRELVPMISPGFDPTDEALQIRVSFDGGLEDDPAYLESISLTGFVDNSFESVVNRDITATHPAVLRGDHQPILYREDNGVYLNGATLSIGPDTSPESTENSVIELWIKPVSGAVTIEPPVSTKYRNGVLDSTVPVGEWSLLHYDFGSAEVNNYHTDPSFESGLNGYTNTTNSSTATDTGTVMSGLNSLKMTTTSAGASSVNSGTIYTLPAGVSQVTARAWVYINPANTGPNASIRISGTGVVPSTSAVVTTEGEWVEIKHTVSTTGSGGTVVLELNGSTGAGDINYWDSVLTGSLIKISGDVIIGQAGLYPSLTSTEIADIYKKYTGRKTNRFVDSGDVSVTEPVSAASIYTRDWSIEAGG